MTNFPRFGHSSVSDTFHGRFAWHLRNHFQDGLQNTNGDFFVRGGNGTNWMFEMVCQYNNCNGASHTKESAYLPTLSVLAKTDIWQGLIPPLLLDNLNI